ncbi:hypothetical protein I4F81_000558 [Pyropia yezoensis]|uniref:Uncharacterized protein n=1 Tax=Pyropia yezoensis TaxID=2788 RepID=A0ACC3BJ02_PYRYE|nr:hypothetical protein I4F81_000558 [Neopyropia yezoensis]
MARDAEKARSMLHRFLSQKAEEEGDGTSIRGSGIGGPKRVQRRPYLASLVEDVGDAQRWRRQLVGEIGTKMLEIQNPSLPHDEAEERAAEAAAVAAAVADWEREHPDGRGERQDDAGADDAGEGWDAAALDAAAARRVGALRLAQRKRQALERLS